MSHFPKNHWLRSAYRIGAGLAGVFCLVFGIVGIVTTHGHGFFAQDSAQAFGLRTNTAFAVLSIVVGLVVMGATIVGRNVDRMVNLVAGPLFLLVGILMLALIRTDANFLDFEMSTCVVSFVIGVVLLTAGLYGHVTSPEDAAGEERFRHGTGSDPETHGWGEDPTRTQVAGGKA